MSGMSKKKHVAIVAFTKVGEASVARRTGGELTKKEVLNEVGKWWDNNGTGLNDYDGIQITVKRRGT